MPIRRRNCRADAFDGREGLGDRGGVARLHERVERRERTAADSGAGEIVERDPGGPVLRERVCAGVPELNRRCGNDERTEDGN
jgi:hypothetical protein